MPATACELQNTGIATMMTFLSHDLPALLGAFSVRATFSGLPVGVLGLASEFTSVMHASSFNTARARKAAESPAAVPRRPRTCGTIRTSRVIAALPHHLSRNEHGNRNGRSMEVERAKGIEPSSVAWKATALPLCYARRPGCC